MNANPGPGTADLRSNSAQQVGQLVIIPSQSRDVEAADDRTHNLSVGRELGTEMNDLRSAALPDPANVDRS